MGIALVDRELASEVALAGEASSSHAQCSAMKMSSPVSFLHQQASSQGCSIAARLEHSNMGHLQGGGNAQLTDSIQPNRDVELDLDLDMEMDMDLDFKSLGGNKANRDDDDDDRLSISETDYAPTTTEVKELEWESVCGLEDVQISALTAVASRGVVWTHPVSKVQKLFTLHHGGDVASDGNCLFTALHRILGQGAKGSLQDIRQAVVRRFWKDYASGVLAKESTDRAIQNLYSPDLKSGWGVHIVQELKLLAKKSERPAMDQAIEDLVLCGMNREPAAEVVYKEKCMSVSDGASWTKFMAVCGSDEDEHDIVTLQYTEEGLLSVEENRQGKAAAFGDDIAIESVASEYGCEVFVVQAHGADGMVDSNSCLFFLPHRPGGAVASETPIFLFMKGTGWCGGGADHYEPIIAKHREASQSGEKPYMFL